ncbi:hypothetical protein B296_00023629 [Ensete ventricosum]|uniref:Uncharacterized protein n=1 Tax=Ensete ventricosum TaxID=4639 RepID=A0A426Z1T2_ENSVE|nr:hypothetical protein B296_00023629 [Ensete ventricosum]
MLDVLGDEVPRERGRVPHHKTVVGRAPRHDGVRRGVVHHLILLSCWCLRSSRPPSLRHRGPVGYPCALARPRSFRDRVGTRPDGWISRVLPHRLAAVVVEFGSGVGSYKEVGSDKLPT